MVHRPQKSSPQSLHTTVASKLRQWGCPERVLELHLQVPGTFAAIWIVVVVWPFGQVATVVFVELFGPATVVIVLMMLHCRGASVVAGHNPRFWP